MNNNIQKRKDEDPAQPRPGLARRATDTTLKGMQIKEDDSDGTWADWEAAMEEAQAVPKPDSAAPGPADAGRPGEDPDTQPLPLDPGT